MRVGSEYQAEVQPQVDNGTTAIHFVIIVTSLCHHFLSGDAGQNGIGSVLIWKPSQVLKNDDSEPNQWPLTTSSDGFRISFCLVYISGSLSDDGS